MDIEENSKQGQTNSKKPNHNKPIKFENQSPVQLIKQSTNGQFGNSKDYYQKRGAIGFNDPRITFFDAKYLTDKKVLDLGCHDGSLTLQVALRYLPKEVFAVDIDYRLISKAVKNVDLFEQKRNIQKGEKEQHISQLKALDTLSKQPKGLMINDEILIKDDQGEQIKPTKQRKNDRMQNELKMSKEFKNDANFPDNVNFGIANAASENFINELDIVFNSKGSNYDSYDTILCLSLTKWIQLNWGDNGIFMLFSNISKLLKVDGHLIVEFQSWNSYKKNKSICDRIKQQQPKIELKPEEFEQTLLDKFGFDIVDCVTNNSADFKRDFKVFKKIKAVF